MSLFFCVTIYQNLCEASKGRHALYSVSIPRAPILVRVLEHGQVVSLGCHFARLLIPRALILVQVFEHSQVASLGCHLAGLLIP